MTILKFSTFSFRTTSTWFSWTLEICKKLYAKFSHHNPTIILFSPGSITILHPHHLTARYWGNFKMSIGICKYFHSQIVLLSITIPYDHSPLITRLEENFLFFELHPVWSSYNSRYVGHSKLDFGQIFIKSFLLREISLHVNVFIWRLLYRFQTKSGNCLTTPFLLSVLKI